MLEACGVEYHGGLWVKPSITLSAITDKLGDFKQCPNATDGLNALWFSDDAVVVYQGWLRFYQQQPPDIVTGWSSMLRIFGKAKQIVAETASRLAETVAGVSESGLRWPRRRLSNQEWEYWS